MITQKQRDAYRYALEDKGVPEVYAYMAACNAGSSIEDLCRFSDAVSLIYGAFYWDAKPEGHQFWSAIANECELLSA